jgi:hypothetical protein
MTGHATRVAHVAPYTHATRNFGTGKRNDERNAGATATGHSPMTASELRTQLRAQQQRNRGVALDATKAPEVARKVAPLRPETPATANGHDAHKTEANSEIPNNTERKERGGRDAQQAAQQHEAASIESPYENPLVARCMHRVLPNATADHDAGNLTARAVVEYHLTDDSKGGTLIDPDGPASAVRELRWRYAHRVDWPALLATFEAREHVADREAAALIRRLMADDFRAATKWPVILR